MKASCLIYWFCFLSAATIIFAGNTKSSAAAGFGVSPSTLDFTVEEGSESSRQLTLYNTGKESEFNAESSSPEVVLVSPSSGTLPEGGTVAVTVTAFGKKAGTSESEIIMSVNSHENGRVSVALGAAVAVKLSVVKGSVLSANAFVGILLSASIVLFGLSGYYASRKKVRQLLSARA
ncbi:hypothetical protein HYV83_05185 [Candidatus Woesearchaeota archaeon]|nr:hypothetical protein [Candidatus Woesearchaeota archaeon]